MLVRRQTPGVSSLPPGVQVNYVDPPSIGYKLVVTDWVLLAPALLLTGIRIFTRLRLLKTWGWDDTFVIFALLIAIARNCTDLVWIYRYHEGRDIWNVPPQDFDGVRNYQEIEYMLYTASIAFVKLSILLFMLRIFDVKRKLRYVNYLLMFIVAAYSLACFLALAFTCQPVYYSWHLPTNPAEYANIKCFDPHTVIVASGALNIASDAAIIALPLPSILSLVMSRAKKLGVLFIFTIGTVSFVVAIVREGYVASKNSLNNGTKADLEDAILLSVELYFGIMCASMPALNVLWNRVLSNSRFGSSVRSLFEMLSITPATEARTVPPHKTSYAGS